jgi:hypothetical protein
VSILDGSTDDLAESGRDEPSLFLGIGGYLLSVAVLAFLAVGVFAFFPHNEHKIKSFVFLAISLPAAFFLMRRAVKFMALILVYGFARALLFPPLTGADPWPVRVFMTVYCFAGGILCLTFMDRKLSLFDRLALLAFLLSICFGGAYDAGPEPDKPTTLMVAGIMVSAGLGVLAIAWAYDRSKGRATSISEGIASFQEQTPRIRWKDILP